MLINNLIFFDLELARKYGVDLAILLQFIHTRNPPDNPLLLAKHLPFTQEKIAKMLTELKADKTIYLQDKRLYIGNTEKQQTIIPEVKKTKKTKEPTPVDFMNEALRTIFKADEYIPYTRYLKLAKQLIEDGHTPEYIVQRYTDPYGYWYTQTTKGKQNKPPTEFDIRQTINDTSVSSYWSA